MKKGQKMSDEQRAKISKAHIGKKKPWSGLYMTEDHKKAISERMKGNKQCLGRVLTDETKEKIRLSNLGKKHNISEEGRARMGVKNYPAWNKGLEGYNAKENNPRWISDRTKLKKKDRQCGSAYSFWRKTVYERDRYQCRLRDTECVGKISAHHIFSWKDYPEMRYVSSNGITLCKFHHPISDKKAKGLISLFQKIIVS